MIAGLHGGLLLTKLYLVTVEINYIAKDSGKQSPFFSVKSPFHAWSLSIKNGIFWDVTLCGS
jgi:hypothetical protein